MALGPPRRTVSDRRAPPLARLIQAALARIAQRELESQFGRVRKSTDQEIVDELVRLIDRYGYAVLREAGDRATRGRWDMQGAGRAFEEIARSKRQKVVLLVEGTAQRVRDRLSELLAESLTEQPRPSATELGRRIARTWFGPGLGVDIGRGTLTEESLTADWRRLPARGEYLFSYERAHTIARTELAQAENVGIAAAYSDIGIRRVRWAAYSDDGRSGEREHWRMREHPSITIEDMQSNDPERWFELPRGAKAPYPNWIGLPAGETVNCRCQLAPA